MYGVRVRVLSERQSATYIRCVIADPDHPSFHYHIHQRWLSATAPVPLAAATPPNSSVIVPLAALDKLVQLILVRQQLRRTSHHASHSLPGHADLATDSPDPENAVEPLAFSPCPADGRKDPS
jgi:hypothetical protein